MDSTIDKKITCPECDGNITLEQNCWDKMGEICSWEWDDTELQREHFLTVAAYNLQHPAKFRDEAINGLKQSLCDYLDHRITPQELRRRASVLYEGSTPVLKKEEDQVVILKAWSMTIDDVYASGNYIGAADRVREWGRVVVGEI